MLKKSRLLTHPWRIETRLAPSKAAASVEAGVRFGTLSVYAKRERSLGKGGSRRAVVWRVRRSTFSAACQFRQIDFERHSRDTDLPSFENFRVQFPNHTDVFPVRHDTSYSPSKK